MSYKIEWRPEAVSDLRGIVAFIAKDNKARAKSFGEELKAKLSPLTNQPGMGRPGRPGLPAGTRELVAHPNYIFFFRVDEARKVVEILALKHASQQVP